MTLDLKKDVLFVGKGATPVCYYRCMLPAMALGADWVGVHGDPPDSVTYVTGLAKRDNGKYDSFRPDFTDYKIIVLQQKVGPGWLKLIDGLREQGIIVLWEVDDYLHGIPHLGEEQHDFAKHFDKKYLWNCEQAMKHCDGVIASTDWIAGSYSHFNKRTFVCRNGIDVKRYDLTVPKRETVNIGWSGGTGHLKAVLPWFQQVGAIMRMRSNTCFVSIGQGFAEGFKPHFPERALTVPWAAIEQYPAAMTMFDIALAPGGVGGWWRGKSDLRWLEAGALGIPAICNPEVYPEVEDGVTGFTAISAQEAGEKLLRLVDDKDLRTEVGKNAKEHVRTHRSSTRMAEQWREVFDSLVS